MRILHCMRTARIGGIERLVVDLIRAQLRMGNRPSLILGRKEGPLLRELEHEEISVFEGKFSSGYDISPKKIYRMVSVMRESELLHMHGFSPATALASIISKVPVVYTFHGLSKGVRPGNPAKNRILEAIKGRYVSKHVDYITANSEFTLKHVEQAYNVENVPHLVVLNGRAFSQERNSDSVPDEGIGEACRDRFVVGVVSRFTERKRIDRVVKAFRLVLKEHDAFLLLVGDGQTMPKIKDQIRQARIEDKVVLTGYKSCVSPYYCLMDVCVVPSQDEPFGLVAVEGYQHGKPVIAFDNSGGLLEIIKPFEPQDVVLSERDLAQRIAYYIQNPEAVKGQEQKRRDYAKNFTIKAMAEKLQRVYLKVTNDSVLGSNNLLE